MTDLAALISAQAQNMFLGEQDLMALRQQADEIDAAYGEFLDLLAPDSLARLTSKSYAA
jgi:hypothetical protein